jgi:hypothetical protein
MTEILPSVEKKVQLYLQLQASDELKKTVGELIQPAIFEDIQRRDIARHIFSLILHTAEPIVADLEVDRKSQVDSEADRLVQEYTKTIEDKGHMYNRSLRLAAEIGAYQHPDSQLGMNLRFKLALPSIEAKKLLAPPFSTVRPDRAYLVASLPGAILISPEKRDEALYRMRRSMGAFASYNKQAMLAPDAYYVNRPTIKRRPAPPAHS